MGFCFLILHCHAYLIQMFIYIPCELIQVLICVLFELLITLIIILLNSLSRIPSTLLSLESATVQLWTFEGLTLTCPFIFAVFLYWHLHIWDQIFSWKFNISISHVFHSKQSPRLRQD
jgi:hypothetical protein